MLASRARGAEGVDAQVFRVDLQLDLLSFWHDGDCHRRGMDAPLGLGFGHALDAVDAALKFQAAVHVGTFDRENNFLHTAEFCLIGADGLALPAAPGSVHRVHAPQAMGKQGRFLTAGTGANFQNNAFFVVGVLGDKQQTQILFALCQIPANFAQLLLYHSSKRRIRFGSQHFFGVFLLLLQVGITAVFFDQGGKFFVITHHPRILVGVGGRVGRGHFVGKLLIAALDLIKFSKILHGFSFAHGHFVGANSVCPRSFTAAAKFPGRYKHRPLHAGADSIPARKSCQYVVQSPLLLARAQNFFDVALDLGAGQHNFMPAALALDFEIHAHTQYIETVRTAGVRLLGLDHVPDLYVHTAHRLS